MDFIERFYADSGVFEIIIFSGTENIKNDNSKGGSSGAGSFLCLLFNKQVAPPEHRCR